MIDELKSAVLHYLDPVFRFEQTLEEAGFLNVRMGQIEDADVWELKLECPSNVRCRNSPEMAKRLREIAEEAHCPIPAGRLIALMARGKVVATFVAPPVGQPL
jgi:hypothetical protein